MAASWLIRFSFSSKSKGSRCFLTLFLRRKKKKRRSFKYSVLQTDLLNKIMFINKNIQKQDILMNFNQKMFICLFRKTSKNYDLPRRVPKYVSQAIDRYSNDEPMKNYMFIIIYLRTREFCFPLFSAVIRTRGSGNLSL